MSDFVIFDTEYTTWEGCLANGWRGNRKKEIVQIGALKIDAQSLQVKDSFECLIQPKVNPVLSEYFEQLTGIDNATVRQNGVSFAEAYARFYVFCAGLPCLYHAWGLDGGDDAVMAENLKLNNLSEGLRLRYYNIAPWFRKRYAEAGITVEKQASGQIAGILGLQVDGHIHNALYDAESIRQGIVYFKGKDLSTLWK